MRTTNGFLSIEDRRFPLIDVKYFPIPTSAPFMVDFREAFEEYARLSARGVPVAYLLDMTGFNPLVISPSVRKHAAQVFHEYVDRLKPVTVAEARVIVSPVTRGILTAFDWLTSANKWPCQQVATMNEGEQWLREMLRRRTAPGASARP